ncbi:MAG: ATPase, T2SS/T4P/T4SS family, partial [Planctomycetota bacterium]
MVNEILDFLQSDGLIGKVDAEQVLMEQRKTGLSVKEILIRLGFVTEEQIAKSVAKQLKIPFINLDHFIVERKTLESIPEDLSRRHNVVPLYQLGNTLAIATSDPFNIYAIDEVQGRNSSEILVAVTTENSIKRAIESYYRVTDSVREAIRDYSAEKETDGEAVTSTETAPDVAEDAPVVRLVNLIITQAIRDGASDIHIEPREKGLQVRYRIDGVLHETISIPSHLLSAVVTRVKILAGMNIAERRLPQDGHIEARHEGKEIDMRVATFPTTHGEMIVLRLLHRGGIHLGLAELGFEPDILHKFETIVSQPHGLILTTGPTGCGKTTTLYAALESINTPEKKIITVEDPVEYELEMVNQSQVNLKAGLTFANGLRAIFRLDPDIIMVGEIRDLESAQIGIQAALTGHLVFSSLHTNDAPSTITRLIDMGIEPFLVSSTLLAAI